MLKARDRVLKTQWVGVDELAVVPYYFDLYPLPRDWSGLRRSFQRHGYRPEYPIVARAGVGAAGAFEIVCGVGRHTVARERGMHRVPIVVRRFDGDEQARAYAIEDNLFNPGAGSRLGLAHLIVLARALKECSGECTPQQVWEAAGVSPSTYWRADGSLMRSVSQILAAHRELQGLDFSRQIAEIIRNDLAPELTRLLAGDVEVNTYHQSQGGRARAKRRVQSEAAKSGKGGRRGRTPVHVPTKSNEPVAEARPETKAPRRKKPPKSDSNLSLFDLKPS
jgi:hypothetical protein